MHCPFCPATDTKVVDSRMADEGTRVRRRRECTECDERFTTYESAELSLPRVVKSKGEREAFSEEKLRYGLERALQKRPVSGDDLEAAIDAILRRLRAFGEREISSYIIGQLVMDALRELDQVAYVRFASVYREFEDVDAFSEEIKKLKDDALAEIERQQLQLIPKK